MGFLPAIVGIEDADGNRIDQPRADGTRAPIMLALDESFNASSEEAGGFTRVRLEAVGSGGSSTVADAVADLSALRAVSAVDREDRQERGVASITESFMFLASSGAGVADDGKFVVRPNDVSLGSAGRWYRMPYQLSRNMLDTPVALTNSSPTLLVGGGRRYVLPPATLTDARVVTLSTTGAATDDTITIERRDATAFPLQVKVGSTTLLMLDVPGAATFRFDGLTWVVMGRQAGAPMRVFNVLDYGARGDETLIAGNGQAERDAIQAAIDAAAAACRDPDGCGATVYFPRGRYVISGASDSLVMRRTPRDRPITYRGEGSSASMIVSTTGDIFRVESLTETAVTDPGLTWGGYGHAFQDLYLNSTGGYLINYDLGSSSNYGFQDAVRPSLHFWRCYFDHPKNGPAIRLRTSSRSRFIDCNGSPFFTHQGNTFLELVDGSASLIGCQPGGALINAYQASELYIAGCRPEGGSLTPALDFERCSAIMISHLNSEGHDEADAIIRMTECHGIIIDGAHIANTDRGYVRLRGRYNIASTALVFGLDDSYPTQRPSVTRTSGSFLTDGVCIGSKVRFVGTASNAGPYTVKEVQHRKLIFAESVVSESVTASGTASAYVTDRANHPSVTFNNGAKTLTRAFGSWVDDGFVAGQKLSRTSSVTAPNRGTNSGDTLTIQNVTDSTITFVESPASETLATLAIIEADWFGGGIVLRDVQDFDIRATSVGSFFSAGAQNRYGIEVDADCSNGRIRFAGPGVVNLGGTDVSVSASAYNVKGEYTGIDNLSDPLTAYFGAHRFAEVDVEENVAHLRVGKTTTPSTLAGLSVKLASGNGYTGVWYDATAGAAGWKAAASADESALGSLADFYAARFMAGASANTALVAQSGRAITANFTNAALGDELGFYFERVGAGSFGLNISTNAFRILGSGSSSLRMEPGANVIIVPGTSMDVYGGGVLRIQTNATGVGFFAKAPAAQQADVGALTNSTTGTTDGTVSDVGAAFNQATLNNNFAELTVKYNELRTLLRNYGLMA